jgi:serine/threonine protein kinase
VRWFAPELIAPTEFGCERFARTPASDVYAYGCVCLEVCPDTDYSSAFLYFSQFYTGSPPFSDVKPDVAAMLRVIAGERPQRPVGMSEELWNLVAAA